MNPLVYYPWNVVHDPERMYTGPFRDIDVKLTARAGYWPEGIIFEHKRTGERLIFRNGNLVKLQRQEKGYGTLH